MWKINHGINKKSFVSAFNVIDNEKKKKKKRLETFGEITFFLQFSNLQQMRKQIEVFIDLD